MREIENRKIMIYTSINLLNTLRSKSSPTIIAYSYMQ